MDVTIENPYEDEFYSGELCIIDESDVLDKFHPVIRVLHNHTAEEYSKRIRGIYEICN